MEGTQGMSRRSVTGKPHYMQSIYLRFYVSAKKEFYFLETILQFTVILGLKSANLLYLSLILGSLFPAYNEVMHFIRKKKLVTSNCFVPYEFIQMVEVDIFCRLKCAFYRL